MNLKEKFENAIAMTTGGDLSDSQVESLWKHLKPLLINSEDK